MKLCWQGLDKWASIKHMAKFIKTLLPDTEGISIAKPPKKCFAFLSFDSQAKMDQFSELFSGELY